MHFPLQDNQPVFCLQEDISLPLLEVANCILDDLAHFERLQSCHGHVASAETLFSNEKSRTRYLNKIEKIGCFFDWSALKMIKCQPEGNLNTVPPQKMTKNETS